MNQTVSRIAPAISRSLLAVLILSAPVAAMAAPAATPSPAPSPNIISLPLQPIVPADLRMCSARTASGLGYTALRTGTGPKPAKTDFVLVSYIGYLATTGQVFDQNQQTPLSLSNVIPGFTEGLQLMARGSVYRLCVPAALGYGAAGAGAAIPANSDLVFQIELVDSKSAAEVEAMRSAQQGAGAQGAATPVPASH